jgi:acylphosphatase
MKEVRALVRIEGRVQGVNFRYHASERARNLNLRGWVKNLADGSVQAVVEGDEADVQQMIAWCRRGPEVAQVDRVDVTIEEARGEFTSFEIVF